jgi:hypothetical protein
VRAPEDWIREVVRDVLGELLPPLVEKSVLAAVVQVRVGDSGDELIDTAATAKLLGTTPGALRRAEERGRAVVPAERLAEPPAKSGETAKRPRLRWRRARVMAYLASAKAPSANLHSPR